MRSAGIQTRCAGATFLVSVLVAPAFAAAAGAVHLSVAGVDAGDEVLARLGQELPEGVLVGNGDEAELRARVTREEAALVLAIDDAAGEPVLRREIPLSGGMVPAQRILVFLLRQSVEQYGREHPASASALVPEAPPSPDARRGAGKSLAWAVEVGSSGRLWHEPGRVIPELFAGAQISMQEITFGVRGARTLPSCCGVATGAVDAEMSGTRVEVDGGGRSSSLSPFWPRPPPRS